MIRFLYIDLFCGAGGTSTGVEAARLHGEQVAKVIACVNHDANAIASHAANHPDALHFVEDIRTLNLDRMLAHVEAMRKQYPAARVVLWASLECTNFSIAKGGQSRDADSRTLAEHLFRYIDALRPDYIQIENVKEFMTWGPLVVKVVEASAGHGEYCPLAIKTEGTGKHKRRTIAPVWVPDAAIAASITAGGWIAFARTEAIGSTTASSIRRTSGPTPPAAGSSGFSPPAGCPSFSRRPPMPRSPPPTCSTPALSGARFVTCWTCTTRAPAYSAAKSRWWMQPSSAYTPGW